LRGVIYSIGPDEVGVIQRFGKFIGSSTPGLHAKIPFGVDKVTPIKVEKVFKAEFGFKTVEPGVKTRYSSAKYTDESLMLTGDLNILDVRWIVQFKIKDPVKLLFATRRPEDNIHDISEVVMRRFVGDYTVDEVLTTKREEIDDMAQQEIQRLLGTADHHDILWFHMDTLPGQSDCNQVAKGGDSLNGASRQRLRSQLADDRLPCFAESLWRCQGGIGQAAGEGDDTRAAA